MNIFRQRSLIEIAIKREIQHVSTIKRQLLSSLFNFVVYYIHEYCLVDLNEDKI